VTMEQAFRIKRTTKDEQFPAGRGLADWQDGLGHAEPGCIRALYALMLEQDGQVTGAWEKLSFPVVRFAAVAGKAFAAAAAAEREREEAEQAAAEAGTVPTSARSAGRSSRRTPDPAAPPGEST